MELTANILESKLKYFNPPVSVPFFPILQGCALLRLQYIFKVKVDEIFSKQIINIKKKKKKKRGHPDLNRGPLDLQSNALPLSYTPDVR